jgi:mannose-6-phosphate isomerase-like protein (cupin superfamily)
MVEILKQDIMRKFKLFLLFVSFCAFTTAQTKDSTQTKWNIHNCVNQFSKDKTIPTNAGYQYWFADKDFLNGRTLKMSVVKPHDATHPPHKHVEDEFFFILEGKAQFYLNGDSVVCEPYASFYCPSMVMHGISNAGNTELKYLVIKDYKPVK